jgi:hypothetical protein
MSSCVIECHTFLLGAADRFHTFVYFRRLVLLHGGISVLWRVTCKFGLLNGGKQFEGESETLIVKISTLPTTLYLILIGL